MSLVNQSRVDLGQASLKWFVSQQPPTNDKSVNNIDVTADLERTVAQDGNVIHLKVFDMPKQDFQLVIDTPGIVWLGQAMAKKYLESR
jgi:hypothetical protein